MANQDQFPKSPEEWEALHRKKEAERRRMQAGIPERYREASLETLIVGHRIVEVGTQFAHDPRGGLFLTGITGSGKTHTAAAIVNRMLDGGKTVWFLNVIKLIARIQATFSHKGKKFETEDEILATCSSVDCLVLDDLGLGKITEFRMERLYLIIDDKYISGKPLIVTSNLSLAEIAVQIDARLASRLYEMCEVIQMPDVDFRTMKRK